MKNWFKKLSIPSGEKTEVVAYNSWIVRWVSVGHESGVGTKLVYTRDESEIFPSETDAHKFAQSLKDAHALLKDRNFVVRVEANQTKLATLQQ